MYGSPLADVGIELFLINPVAKSYYISMSRSSRSSVGESGAALALQGGRLNRLFLIFLGWTSMGPPQSEFRRKFCDERFGRPFPSTGMQFSEGPVKG